MRHIYTNRVLTSGISRRFWVIKAVGLQRYTRMLAHEVWNVSGVRLMIYRLLELVSAERCFFTCIIFSFFPPRHQSIPSPLQARCTRAIYHPLVHAHYPTPSIPSTLFTHGPFSHACFQICKQTETKQPHLEVSYVSAAGLWLILS